MDLESGAHLSEENGSDNNVSVRDLIDKYLRYWKWFILSLVFSLFFAYLKLNFTRPTYEAVTTIKIKDEKGSDKSALSAFQDLGLMSSSNRNIEDEIEILKSKSLISEVIKSLRLNIKFFTNKNKVSSFLDDNLGFNTEFYETEEYVNPPLKVNFFISDSLLYEIGNQFIIDINSTNQYTFRDINNSIERKFNFGEKNITNFGDIVITPLVDLKVKGLVGSSVLVSISPVKDLASSYAENILIEPNAEFSSVLTLTASDGVKKKTEDFLNELVKKYNERAINLKEDLSKSTSDFVTKRLAKISQELSDVDEDVESVKTRFQLSDVASSTGLNMESGQALENQIVETSTQLEKINAIRDFVQNKNDNELIPITVLGGNAGGVSDLTNQYNELMMQKKRLLENSTEKNPIVVNLNQQLKSLESNIAQGLSNLESSQQISLDALQKQGARINSRLYAAPKHERQYRDITRQQQIKEQLFLYLLQKREETAITLGVADPNAKVIDAAESMPNAIAPKKKIMFLVAIFIGLLIPFSIIYILDILDSKVHTREDVEKILSIPILGDIPKVEKERYIISKEDHSSAAEAFRILRTNLNFILDSSIKGKTIFITSTIAHEGKSMIATNLAASLALAGKKTLIIGLDIRAPKIKSYLGVRGDIGITNYVVNPTISFDDLIVRPKDFENLDVISSGDLAPNPSELLMNLRIKELFDRAKEKYEYIIVDTAAFSMVTDTMLLSGHADAFIYVIRANFLDKRFLKYIKGLYTNKRLPNLSLLVNGVDHKKSYGYGYGYGYGSDFEKQNKKQWWKFS